MYKRKLRGWAKHLDFLIADLICLHQDSIGRKKTFWSDGYFACSIGEISSATIQKYIESQE